MGYHEVWERRDGGGEFRLFFFVGGTRGRVGEEDLCSTGYDTRCLVVLARAASG